MPTRWSLPRGITVLALPLAFWTAVPAVQWCAMGGGPVRVECLVACTETAGPANACTAPTCGAACESDAACDGATCEPSDGACSNSDSCSPSDGCTPCERHFCVGAPNGGLAMRASPLRLEPLRPLRPLPASAASVELIAPTSDARPFVVDAVERPPTSPCPALPLARAPPATSLC